MRNMFTIAVLCVLSLSLAAGQQAGAPQKAKTKAEAASATSVEDQIKKHEQDWAQATMKVRCICGGSI